MPIFINGGPNIPEYLLHEHEEGRVVFFCGAGISAAAGLPLFGKLVSILYENNGNNPNKIQSRIIKDGNYDTAVELLEECHQGGRKAIRKGLKNILTPKLGKKYALTMHKSLLILGTNRDGAVRIITTNYDHLFREAQKNIQKNKDILEFHAPLLPIPKPSQWNGLVYIHGILPDDNDDKKLDTLILSSSDFGHAYLTERWASRFISELFKNYTVCFVGYSLSDPVMRYIVDAIAADKKCGDISHNDIYAFVGYKKNNRSYVEQEWKSKKITPILYDSRGCGQHSPHARLYKTFELWSSMYRDGITGKKNIISKYASHPPLSDLAKNDMAVGNVLWALTDAKAAEYFAKMDPVPPLDWLKPLSMPQFSTKDLNRFGFSLSSNAEKLNKEFSFLDRPAPHTTSRMRLFYSDWDSCWDEIMTSLATWLLKHLNNPKLALWLSKSGGHLNEYFKKMLEKELISLSNLRDSDSVQNLLMKKIWLLFLSDRIGIYSPNDDFKFYNIMELVRNYGISYEIKLMIKYALTPYVILKDKLLNSNYQSVQSIDSIFNWDIKLRYGHIKSALEYSTHQNGHDKWISAQPDLLNIYNLLLKDLCELKSLFDGSSAKNDMSYIYRPSIEEHTQNNDYAQWTILIELLRDSWVAISKVDTHMAAKIAEEWWNTPFPLFKRLAFFACKHTNIVAPEVFINWLLEDNAYWLWSIETQREVMRLLSNFNISSSHEAYSRLEETILSGPPRNLFKEDISSERCEYIKDRATWLRLVKLHEGNSMLSEQGQTSLEKLYEKYPKFKLRQGEKEEFVVWMGQDSSSPVITTTPKSCNELADYLERYPESNQWGAGDDWKIRCENNFDEAFCALEKLAQKEVWPVSRWQDFLYSSSIVDKINNKDYSLRLYEIIYRINDKTFYLISNALSDCLEKLSRNNTSENIDYFIDICNRIITIYNQDENIDSKDYITAAINHPIGKITESLINTWFKIKNNIDNIDQKFKYIFSILCDTKIRIYKYARVILCTNIVLFYQNDIDWTNKYLLPLFSWNNSNEAIVAWQGFLYSPRLYQPFISEIKYELIAVSRNYNSLGIFAERYASLMTYVALDRMEQFTKKELHSIFDIFPDKGLISCIRTLNHEMESIDSQTKNYFENRIKPFFKEIWPNSWQGEITDELLFSISYFYIKSGENFPEAINLPIIYWLRPLQQPDVILHTLQSSNLCKKFPKESLIFLDKIIGKNIDHILKILEKCLEQISDSDSSLQDDPIFIRLSRFI